MKKLSLKKTFWLLIRLCIYFNLIICFHAYKFTHYTKTTDASKTQSPSKLTTWQKVTTAIFGVNNPRPENTSLPKQKYQTILLQSNKQIELWQITVPNPKGTIAIFHGYGGSKSLMLNKSDEFIKMGYNTVLVDFMGSGGSEGNQTTIGYDEAQEVKSVYDYLLNNHTQNIYLFGTSMGAVAVMKAIADYHITPKAIIIECPFGSMYQTAINRFKQMQAPYIPMAGLLVFWGGIMNGFWAFSHTPTEYAKTITVPTLLLYGEEDKNVTRTEIDTIYHNLAGKKTLVTFKNAGHTDYLLDYSKEWINATKSFLLAN